MALDESVAGNDAATHRSDHDALHVAHNVFDGTWIQNLFLNPDTPHADDQEFTGVISGTAVTPAGTAVWTQEGSLLSGVFDDQASQDIAPRLYALTPSAAAVTIETCVNLFIVGQDFNKTGLVFTDGVTTGSNAMTAYKTSYDEIFAMKDGTITAIDGTTTSIALIGTTTANITNSGRLYMRLIWTAANTFKAQVSSDGISWISTATGSKTMTPTHFGVFGTTGGGTSPDVTSFEYVRVYESDLSA